MKKTFAYIAALAIVASITASAQAGVTNIRPVNTNLSGLEAVMDGIAQDGDYDLDFINDQASAAIWGPTSNAVNTTVINIVDFNQNLAGARVGIYQFGDTSNKIDLINPLSGVGAGDTVLIQFLANGTVRTIDGDTLAIIDSQANFGQEFGLFLEFDGPMGGTTTWYTEDSENGGSAQVLAYEASGEAVTIDGQNFASDANHYYFAFESSLTNLRTPPSSSFDDVVLQLESVTPIPAPGAALLACMGLSFVARLRRRNA